MPNWEVMDEAALAAADELRGALDAGVKFVKLKSGATADKYGANPMRILPKHTNMISWYHPVPVHFVNGKSVGCVRLLSGGKSNCLICEAAFEIIKVDEKRGKKMLPGWSAYMNVLLLGTDGKLADNRVQILSVRTGVLDQIRDAFAEKGDLTHPFNGRNINLKKKGEQLNSEYLVVPSDVCPIPVDDLDSLEVIDLTQVTEFLDDEGARALLAGGGRAGRGDAFEEEAAPPSRQLAAPAGGFAEDETDPGPSDDGEAPAEVVQAEVVAGGFAADDDGGAEAPAPAPAAAKPAAAKKTTVPKAPTAAAGSPAGDALARLRAATAPK